MYFGWFQCRAKGISDERWPEFAESCDALIKTFLKPPATTASASSSTSTPAQRSQPLDPQQQQWSQPNQWPVAGHQQQWYNPPRMPWPQPHQPQPWYVKLHRIHCMSYLFAFLLIDTNITHLFQAAVVLHSSGLHNYLHSCGLLPVAPAASAASATDHVHLISPNMGSPQAGHGTSCTPVQTAVQDPVGLHPIRPSSTPIPSSVRTY